MKRVIFCSWHDDTSLMASAKVLYLQSHGCEVVNAWGKKTAGAWRVIMDEADHVFIYNGFRPECKPIREALEQVEVPVTYWEGGIFPARPYQFVDRKGILGASSFCDDISWVTDKHVDDLLAWKPGYLERAELEPDAKWTGGDYIFCPMQAHWDANFQNGWSKYTGKNAMVDFIQDMQREYPDDRILFRVHPAEIKRLDEMRAHVIGENEVVASEWSTNPKTEEEVLRQMLNAKRVVGINTTCLLQSVLLGVPTTALGWGYIKAAGDDPEQQLRMVAAVKSRTFRWNDNDECARVMEEVHEGDAFWA